MKFKSLLMVVLAVVLCTAFVHAQTVSSGDMVLRVSDSGQPVLTVAANGDMTGANALLTLVLNLAKNHPWLATLISFMGLARVWAKPVSSIVHSIVDLTPTKTDDSVLASVMGFFLTNSVGKFLAYALDYLTSIKIQPPADNK